MTSTYRNYVTVSYTTKEPTDMPIDPTADDCIRQTLDELGYEPVHGDSGSGFGRRDIQFVLNKYPEQIGDEIVNAICDRVLVLHVGIGFNFDIDYDLIPEHAK